MWDKGGDNDQIDTRIRLLTGADDVVSPGMEHQVYLVFRVTVDGIVELGVPVVENYEKVVALNGCYLLLDVLHTCKNKKKFKIVSLFCCIVEK